MYFCVFLYILVLFYVFLCCSMYFCFVLYIFVFSIYFCVFLCIFVLLYIFLCCSMYFCVVLCIFVLFYIFLCCSMYFCVVLCIFVLFYIFLCCSVYCLFCVVPCIVCLYMCTVLLPPGGYPIAVNKYIILFFFIWRNSPQWAIASSFTRFLDHTQRRTTVSRTPLYEWSAHCRDRYLTTHNTHNRQTSMPPVGFEPTISTSERPQTYSLERAITGSGISYFIIRINKLAMTSHAACQLFLTILDSHFNTLRTGDADLRF